MTLDADPSASRAAKAAELFESPKLSVDKLPGLRALFERVSAGCVENYKDLMTAPITCSVEHVETWDSRNIINGLENCIVSVLHVTEWDAPVLIALEKRLLFSVIDVMFGGDGSEPPAEPAQDFSRLELHVARELFERTARCMSAAIEPLAKIQIALERIESKIDLNILAPPNLPSVSAQMLFQILGIGGRMFVVMPRAPLATLRKELERGTLKASQADDPHWTRQLQSRVVASNVSIRATANGPQMTLGELAALQVGQILHIEGTAGTMIVLESGSTPMFTCSLGQLEGWYSIKVDTPIGPPKGLTELVISEAMSGWGAAP